MPEELRNNGEYYGLKLGLSNFGRINNGDTVISKKVSSADSGAEIAVVLIDDQEATLKEYLKKDKTIALKALK